MIMPNYYIYVRKCTILCVIIKILINDFGFDFMHVNGNQVIGMHYYDLANNI